MAELIAGGFITFTAVAGLVCGAVLGYQWGLTRKRFHFKTPQPPLPPLPPATDYQIRVWNDQWHSHSWRWGIWRAGQEVSIFHGEPLITECPRYDLDYGTTLYCFGKAKSKREAEAAAHKTIKKMRQLDRLAKKIDPRYAIYEVPVPK